MCEKTKADMSGNKLKMPISLQPPPAQALTGQPRPLIPCVNEWCPQNNTQSPLSIHLAPRFFSFALAAVSSSPSTSSPCPLSHPSFPHLFIGLFSALNSLHLCVSDPISHYKYFQPFDHHLSLVPVCTFFALCPVLLPLSRFSHHPRPYLPFSAHCSNFSIVRTFVLSYHLFLAQCSTHLWSRQS